jgi:hypothetical protein
VLGGEAAARHAPHHARGVALPRIAVAASQILALRLRPTSFTRMSSGRIGEGGADRPHRSASLLSTQTQEFHLELLTISGKSDLATQRCNPLARGDRQLILNMGRNLARARERLPPPS